MQISFSITQKDFVTLGWVIGWGLLLSLTIGSQWESEPHAARMFGVLTAVWTAVAYPIFKWRNR